MPAPSPANSARRLPRVALFLLALTVVFMVTLVTIESWTIFRHGAVMGQVENKVPPRTPEVKGQAGVANQSELDKYKAQLDSYRTELDSHKGQLDNYKAQLDGYKAQLDSYKAQTDDLQKLITLLVTFSSLYTLILGVSSYLSAQGLIKQSEDNAEKIRTLRDETETGLNKSIEENANKIAALRVDTERTFQQSTQDLIKKSEDKANTIEAMGLDLKRSVQDLIEQAKDKANTIETLRASIEKSFPFFRDMGGRMDAMKNKMEVLMPDSDERDDYYDRLDAQGKQELEAFELSAVSWLYFLDFSESRKMASGIYRNLGKFFGARHKEARDALRKEIEAANQSPVNSGAPKIDEQARRREIQSLQDRADFYFSKALHYDQDDFLTWNDQAFFIQDFEGDQSVRAEKCYETSRGLHPRQQRAYYNLAIIQKGRDNFIKAEELSTDALGHPNWQIKPNEEREHDVQYNRACYRSLIGAQSPAGEEKKWADGVEEDLRQACRKIGPKGDAIRLKLLMDDCAKGWDLEWFAGKRPDVVKELKTNLGG